MKKRSTRVLHKKPHVDGKSARRIGHDPVLPLRMPPGLTKEVDEWAKAQDDKPNRSEAMRRLMEFGLKHSKK